MTRRTIISPIFNTVWLPEVGKQARYHDIPVLILRRCDENPSRVMSVWECLGADGETKTYRGFQLSKNED